MQNQQFTVPCLIVQKSLEFLERGVGMQSVQSLLPLLLLSLGVLQLESGELGLLGLDLGLELA